MIDPADLPPEDLEKFLASARGIPAVDPAAKSALFSRILMGIGAPPDPSGDGGSNPGGPPMPPMPPAPPVPPTVPIPPGLLAPPADLVESHPGQSLASVPVEPTAMPLAPLRPVPSGEPLTVPPLPLKPALGTLSAQQIAGIVLVFSMGGVTGVVADRAWREPEVRTVYVDSTRPASSVPKPGAVDATPATPGQGATTLVHDSARNPADSASTSPVPQPVSTESVSTAHAPSATPAASDSASATLKDPKESKDAELSSERSLLERARSALARGNVSGAIEALNRHVTEFPRGRLSEEREAIWIQALAASGRTGEARQRLARYKASFPHSFSLPALEAALGEP